MSGIERVSSHSRNDITVIILVATIWGERLLYYVRSVLLRLPFIGQLAEPFIGIVIVAVIIFTLRYVKKRIELRDIAFVFCCIFLYFFHMALYEDNYPYLLDILPKFIFIVLPFFLLGIICDIDKCINVLVKISLAYVVLGVLYYYYVTFVAQTFEMLNEDEMGIAYQFLPHVLLLLYATLKKFNIFYLIGFVLGLFIILGTGNRGSILLVVFFSGLYFFFGTKKNIKVKFVAIAIAILVLININVIVGYLSDLFNDVGLSVRVLQMLEDNEFADDNGRFAMNNLIDNAKRNSPLFGYGLCGDRTILGIYCHNLYNEIIISFGWLIGLIIFSSIIILLIKSIFSCTSQDQRFFLFLLLCCGFIKLFLSNSFLEERYFFFLLGYAVSIIRIKEKEHKKTISTNETKSNIQHLLSDSIAPAILHGK